MRVEQTVSQPVSVGAASGSGSFRAALALATERTPLAAGAAQNALGAACREVLGAPASPSTLALLTAQWAHETDAGRAMWGNNFGGIRARRGGVSLMTREGSGANAVRVRGDFRSYATAQGGAEDFVRLLARRYPQALSAAAQGSVERFAAELARAGYFTADVGEYVRGLRFRLTTLAGGHAPAAGAGVGSVVSVFLEPVLRWLSRAAARD